MLERWQSDDAYDARRVLTAEGPMAAFNEAGVLTAADVHVATRICDVAGESDADVRLAVALAIRSVRHGSVCLRLAELDLDEDLPWPALEQWHDKVAASAVVAKGALAVRDDAIYLERFLREESHVRDDLWRRLDAGPPTTGDLTEAAHRLFPGEGYDEQRTAALAAAGQWTTVLTGGPGTGKTTTVAGLLALLLSDDPTLRIGLAAPTGKAAARLQESIEQARTRLAPEDAARLEGLTASTLHRLLVREPGTSTRFRHHRLNTLPHDVVIVDETSMVSLTMMARIVDAVRADARLILVGDPAQLASVEAGAVLADLVDGLRERAPQALGELQTTHRFGGEIGQLAAAVRQGDVDGAMALLSSGTEVRLIDADDRTAHNGLRHELTRHALGVRNAALTGDATTAATASDGHRLLCAHRDGPYGAASWNRQIERWLAEATGEPIGASWGREWYAGRPVLVTANDYGMGLFNGDTGVTVASGDDLTVRIGARDIAPSRLSEVETVHAMTVHKSQGGQAGRITVVLPEVDSPLLTRELLYTAITRAQESVTIVAPAGAVEAAIARPVRRASGLAQRLGAD
jgi:exodeoxyribonuclease V alpha subunit